MYIFFIVREEINMELDAFDFKQTLWETLMTLDVKEVRSRKSISVRCPFCGDTKKDAKHTHFYITIDKRRLEEPIFYNCFLCNTSGIMTQDVLRMLDIHDINITTSMKVFNKSIKGRIVELALRDNNHQMKVPVAKDTKLNRKKLKYLNDRLMIDIDFEKASELKVVFDLEEFLKVNEIEDVTCNSSKAIDLRDNYIGFLSVRNETINFRQVIKSPNKRYEKYPIFKELDNTRKFYSIPTKIDVLSTDLATINIAEGPFDALGIFFHVLDCDMERSIVTAATGSGFKSVVQYFVQQGVVGDNIILNLFVDNEEDKTNRYYKKQLGNLTEWFGETNIIRNTKSKDMGVPKYQIKTIKTKL